MSVGYAFCYAITAACSSANTFAVNMPDVTRYAHNPRACTIAQAVFLPVCLTLISLLGVTLAATSQVLYGQVYWNPVGFVLFAVSSSRHHMNACLYRCDHVLEDQILLLYCV